MPKIKINKNFLIVIIVLSCLSFFVPAYGFNYVIFTPSTKNGDCTSHDIPSQSYPAKWETYTDQVFNTTVRRFTSGISDFGGSPIIQYTTFAVDNSNGTKAVFNSNSNIARVFYNTSDGSVIRNKTLICSPAPHNGDCEFRWSHSNPDMGWFRDQRRFCSYNVNTDTIAVVHDFEAQFGSNVIIQNNDKGEQSWDPNDTWWAFAVYTGPGAFDASHIISYNRVTDTVYTVNLANLYTQQGWTGTPGVRYVTASPSGNYVIAKIYENTSGLGVRIILLERSGNDLVYVRTLIASDSGHPAWGYDAEGNEIFVWCAWLPSFFWVKLSDGIQHSLFVGGGWNSDCSQCISSCPGPEGATHVSSSYNRNQDGWFFYTNYSGSGPTNTFWLQRELWAVRFSSDPSKVIAWRIASCRGIQTSYNDQMRAQLSQDGRYVYFDSNWLNTQNREIFRAELPDNWWIDLAGLTSPDTTPPVISNGSPTGTLAAGTTQTTISVTTDENATCRWSTTAGTVYSAMTNTFSTTGRISHSTTIIGLTNGQTYNYYVRCQDTAGNANTSDYTITFSVASDTTPPAAPTGVRVE